MMTNNRSSWFVAAVIILSLASFGFAGSECCSKGGGAKNDSQTTESQCVAKGKHQCSAECKTMGCAHAEAKGGGCKHGDSGTTEPGCGKKN